MSHRNIGELVEILLVEDNPGDTLLAKKALELGRVANNLHCVEDGESALAFLRGAGAYCNSPRPDLVLLDLNLPGMDGREVLAEIKSDPNLRSIPVVVLTTSKSEQDVLESYAVHANCYINKPVNLEDFIHVVQSIEAFWVGIVTLPSR